MLVLPSGSSFWYAIDTEGNQYSFDPVSNLALNRSFVVHTYTAEEVANLDNFPSGYWMVSWSGSSQYITVKFEEYSKFFLWLNRFLINFSLAVFTVGLALIPVCFRPLCWGIPLVKLIFPPLTVSVALHSVLPSLKNTVFLRIVKMM